MAATVTVCWQLVSCMALLCVMCNAAGKHPKVKVPSAKSQIRDGQVCSIGSGPILGACNMHCQCLSGKYRCCRVRKDFNDLDANELKFFTRMMRKARYDPKVTNAFKELVRFHETTNELTLHTYPNFIIWHRMYVYLLETHIRESYDCRFTVPYYDMTKNWDKWWLYPPWDDEHLGGDGVGSKCCVATGPYRKGKWSTVFPFKIPGTCLKRTFNKHGAMVSPRVLAVLFKSLQAKDFRYFNSAMARLVHDQAHDHIGGYQRYATSASINDPVFWVIHSFVDKVLTAWQAQGSEHLTYPFGRMKKAISNQPPGYNFTFIEMHDNFNLPKNTRICYTTSAPSLLKYSKYFLKGYSDTREWSFHAASSIKQVVSVMNAEELVQTTDLVRIFMDRGMLRKKKVKLVDCLFNSTLGKVLHLKHPKVIHVKHPKVIHVKHPRVIQVKHPKVIHVKHPKVASKTVKG